MKMSVIVSDYQIKTEEEEYNEAEMSLTGKYQQDSGLPCMRKWLQCNKFNEISKSLISAFEQLAKS